MYKILYPPHPIKKRNEYCKNVLCRYKATFKARLVIKGRINKTVKRIGVIRGNESFFPRKISVLFAAVLRISIGDRWCDKPTLQRTDWVFIIQKFPIAGIRDEWQRNYPGGTHAAPIHKRCVVTMNRDK
jgi:hypothetical protein